MLSITAAVLFIEILYEDLVLRFIKQNINLHNDKKYERALLSRTSGSKLMEFNRIVPTNNASMLNMNINSENI